jgi:hypothetical protein
LKRGVGAEPWVRSVRHGHGDADRRCGVEARGVLAGREVASVVEGAGGDVGFDAVEDLLHLLPVGGRVGKCRVLPAASALITKVEEQRASLAVLANATHGRHLHSPSG